MRYVCAIEIALPLKRTAHLLADPTQMRSWLRGLESHEPISGEHGRVGTRSRVVMRAGERLMDAAEAITRREPADLGTISEGTVVRYEREIVADGMWNAARERLTASTRRRRRGAATTSTGSITSSCVSSHRS